MNRLDWGGTVFPDWVLTIGTVQYRNDVIMIIESNVQVIYQTSRTPYSAPAQWLDKDEMLKYFVKFKRLSRLDAKEKFEII
jgi:hypothetical protein